MCTWNLLVVTGPNIAFNQPASQGATHENDTANRVVDGNTSTAAAAKLWWSVKFDKPFVLTGIRLLNSGYAGMCVLISSIFVCDICMPDFEQSTTATLAKHSVSVLIMYFFQLVYL